MVAPSAWASHILVDSKSEAIQIRQKISKLKEFQKFARKKSTCPSSQKGGDLGWFRKGMMVREFDDAVWSIPLSTTSEPVKSQFGYHLIWVHEREESWMFKVGLENYSVLGKHGVGFVHIYVFLTASSYDLAAVYF